MVEHIFTINADKYTATDAEGLVTGMFYYKFLGCVQYRRRFCYKKSETNEKKA